MTFRPQHYLAVALAVVLACAFVVAARADATAPGTGLSRPCDVNGSGSIDLDDLAVIRASIGQGTYPGDPRDANADGKITLVDVRTCAAWCTQPRCAR
jgi:hypothetical protein